MTKCMDFILLINVIEVIERKIKIMSLTVQKVYFNLLGVSKLEL